ncbi:TonB-dependent receptor [Nonlabens sp.]|uniref:TonB-dependent receptor n=1 Tax=Nonlabens sp. TaxID=1888209 RepID=UPI003F69757F
MKHLDLLLIVFVVVNSAFAKAQSTSTSQDITITIVSEKNQELLLGATAYIKALELGAMADVNGKAVLKNVPTGTHQVSISFLGYASETLEITVPGASTYTIALKQDSSKLKEIVIQSTRSTRSFKRMPTRIEFIGGEELVEKNAMNSTNISMVLRESTGIQMQQTSQSSANQSIRIQGLDGRYTQLLKDGFPLYGGFSGGLSIMQIPPLDIKQFEIIKGSSSTLYGGGAIAGLVNMQTKTPEEEKELDLMLVGTQALGTTFNTFYSGRGEKWGTTLFANANFQQAYDPDGDEFSNLPETTSVTVNPRVFYYPSEKATLWLGLNATYDDRTGGFLDVIDGSRTGYTETNESSRLNSQFSYDQQLTSNSSLQVKNSLSYFNRDLILPNSIFSGEQTNSFTEVNYKTQREKTDWILGANLYTSSFNETSEFNRNQDDTTVGVFANNIYDISDRWILETGLRTDVTADWGTFVLPRVSLLFNGSGGFTSRLGGGLGYKIPDLFTEEAEFVRFQNVLAIDKDRLSAETSYGMNLDFNYVTRLSDDVKFSINQLFYLTAIENGLLLQESPLGNSSLEYFNAPDITLSRGAETNMKFSYKDFKLFLNYAFIDTRLNFLEGNPQKPLTARHNAGAVLMYETEDWRIGYESYYTGEQLLFNGTETTDFITMGLLVMKNFEWGHLYANFENFTDRRQSRFSPTLAVYNGVPTFNEIYAPTDGFILSLGVIWKPFGNHEEHHDDD